MPPDFLRREPVRHWLAFGLLLGLFLTFRGYRSLEGDQAYRLPILRHLQRSSAFAADPFICAFDVFNPHKGYLALLDWASRPAGLSVALAAVFAAMFLATCRGVDRLARCVWPEEPSPVGLVAIGLVVIAQAGNIGTNHLFEPILLDRLIALGLGWNALAAAVRDPRRALWESPAWIGVAALVHPSIGLQLALLLTTGLAGWKWAGEASDVSPWRLVVGGLALGLSVAPGYMLNVGISIRLMDGLPAEEFRRLTAYLQSPQHMVPHLWRMPQWLAFACYPILALLSLVQAPVSPSTARRRLSLLLAVNLLGLGAAWYGIERLEHPALTLFQPFRMATIARGLCLVALAGHFVRLWNRGTAEGRCRALLLAAGLIGDWRLVVVTLFEAAMTLCDRTRLPRWAAWFVLVGGLVYLSRHDTESGQGPLLAVGALGIALGRIEWQPRPWTGRRILLRYAAAWAVPVGALVANLTCGDRPTGFAAFLVHHCRFAAVPLDDVERLALWCGRNTPEDARFIGPPGPKGFRLWSGRGLAFNRAGSPYQAKALADWVERYRAHVGFEGTNDEFVAAYLRNRQEVDRGFDRLTGDDLATLAEGQGALFVIASARIDDGRSKTPLERVHVEGRYAVYRVREPEIVADARPVSAPRAPHRRAPGNP